MILPESDEDVSEKGVRNGIRVITFRHGSIWFLLVLNVERV